MTTDLILGTAGHIDHGKTALIRALTGTETDRLPEEKRRGITIELGFAELELDSFRLGIVDVPGHERFVRNMLAGASGMDLAMLVVAADDSIKPQTREHLEILRLLRLKAGVIVITKCDLVDDDWIHLVEEEVRDLCQGTVLATAPIVRTSTETGEGIEELREALLGSARQAAETLSSDLQDAPFRMAIDRVFTMTGHGTVVTGSVTSGQTELGAELEIQPETIPVRVRGLQNHDESVERVIRGQRAAINLAGIHHNDLTRGRELAAPGHLVSHRLLTVSLRLLESIPRGIKKRRQVRIHVGTAEELGSVQLLGADELKPGEHAFAQLHLQNPVAVVWDQPFVLRDQSPMVTIGGGQVLDPSARKIRSTAKESLQYLADLQSDEPDTRAASTLYLAGQHGWDPADLPRTAGIANPAGIAERLREEGILREITLSHSRVIRIHTEILLQLCQQIESSLLQLHQATPLQTMLDLNRLKKRFAYLAGPAVLDAVLQEMEQKKTIRLNNQRIGLVGQGPKLSQNEQKLLTQLVEQFRQSGLETPSTQQCQQSASRNQDSVPELLALAAANGELVQISQEYYLHTETEEQIRQQLDKHLSADNGLTLSEIRELLGTTRKFAVPLCEYFDEIGFTRRDGSLRYRN